MNVETRERIGEWLEMVASVAWLLMDFAWMEQSATFALVFAVPTTVGSIVAIGFVRADIRTRAVTGAMAAWSVMNALWMVSDFGVFEAMLMARISAVLGVVLLAVAYITSGSWSALREFRRVRGGNR